MLKKFGLLISQPACGTDQTKRSLEVNILWRLPYQTGTLQPCIRGWFPLIETKTKQSFCRLIQTKQSQSQLQCRCRKSVEFCHNLNQRGRNYPWSKKGNKCLCQNFTNLVNSNFRGRRLQSGVPAYWGRHLVSQRWFNYIYSSLHFNKIKTNTLNNQHTVLRFAL